MKYTEAGSAIHNEPARKGHKNKKNPGINPRQPVEMGGNKKNPSINLGSPPEKGEKKKEKRKIMVLTLGSAI